MKRKELVRQLEEIGCILIRPGRKHDWYQRPETKIAQPVLRHSKSMTVLASISQECCSVRASRR